MTLQSLESVPTAELLSHEDSPVVATLVSERRQSWVFRVIHWLLRMTSHVFGLASIVVCTSVAANIPVIQFLSFGYLIEVSGRLSRGNFVVGIDGWRFQSFPHRQRRFRDLVVVDTDTIFLGQLVVRGLPD